LVRYISLPLLEVPCTVFGSIVSVLYFVTTLNCLVFFLSLLVLSYYFLHTRTFFLLLLSLLQTPDFQSIRSAIISKSCNPFFPHASLLLS
jgi:hypothetical protein